MIDGKHDVMKWSGHGAPGEDFVGEVVVVGAGKGLSAVSGEFLFAPDTIEKLLSEDDVVTAVGIHEEVRSHTEHFITVFVIIVTFVIMVTFVIIVIIFLVGVSNVRTIIFLV